MPSVRPGLSYAMRLRPISPFCLKKKKKKKKNNNDLSSTVEGSLKYPTRNSKSCWAGTLFSNNFNVDSVIGWARSICGGKTSNKNVQLVLHHCCKTSRIATLRILPPTIKPALQQIRWLQVAKSCFRKCRLVILFAKKSVYVGLQLPAQRKLVL